MSYSPAKVGYFPAKLAILVLYNNAKWAIFPKWAIFSPNGLFSRQFGYFPPEWTIFLPNGLFYRQIGYFTAKWAILSLNWLISHQIGYPSTIQQRQMGFFPANWAIFPLNGLFSCQIGYFPAKLTILVCQFVASSIFRLQRSFKGQDKYTYLEIGGFPNILIQMPSYMPNLGMVAIHIPEIGVLGTRQVLIKINIICGAFHI